MQGPEAAPLSTHRFCLLLEAWPAGFREQGKHQAETALPCPARARRCCPGAPGCCGLGWQGVRRSHRLSGSSCDPVSESATQRGEPRVPRAPPLAVTPRATPAHALLCSGCETRGRGPSSCGLPTSLGSERPTLCAPVLWGVALGRPTDLSQSLHSGTRASPTIRSLSARSRSKRLVNSAEEMLGPQE